MKQLTFVLSCSFVWLTAAAPGCIGAPTPHPTPSAPVAAPPPATPEPPLAPPKTDQMSEPSARKPLPTPSGEQTPRSKICPGGKYPSPPVTATRAKLLKNGFVFVEGPVWSDQLGALLFSEMDFNADDTNGPPSKIHLLTPEGQLFSFLENSGSNGLGIDTQGLVAATHDNQALSRIDLASKRRSVIVDNIGGKKFNSPNDLAISSKGDIYFSDPDYQLGKRPKQTGVTGLYWVKPDRTVTLVDGTLDKPNGVALSPDEGTLYVGSSDGVVWSYTIESGKPGSRKRFAEVEGPDGMAIDCAGNLYATSHGPGRVEVFDAESKKLASIEVAPKATNAAFGGPERKTLYITAGSGLYAVDVDVPGYPF